MCVPVHDGVKGVPWFKGGHECGWVVPELLIGEPSDRPTLELVQPSIGGLVSPEEERRAIVKTLEGANIWSRVTGGGIQVREYARTLAEDPTALEVVTKAMVSYVRWVQEKYPALTHVKYGALRTFANQRSQYSRHGKSFTQITRWTARTSHHHSDQLQSSWHSTLLGSSISPQNLLAEVSWSR